MLVVGGRSFVGVAAVDVSEGGIGHDLARRRKCLKGVALDERVVEGQAPACHQRAVVVEAIADRPRICVRLGMAFVCPVVAAFESVEACVGNGGSPGGEGSFGHLDSTAAIPSADLDNVGAARYTDGSRQQFAQSFVAARRAEGRVGDGLLVGALVMHHVGAERRLMESIEAKAAGRQVADLQAVRLVQQGQPIQNRVVVGLLVVEGFERIVEAPIVGQERSAPDSCEVEGEPRAFAFPD